MNKNFKDLEKQMDDFEIDLHKKGNIPNAPKVNVEQSQPQEESRKEGNNFANEKLPTKTTHMCSVCDECGFVSQSTRGLKIHKSSKHNNSSSEEFTCKECEAKLKTKEQFLCHMKVYHNS